MRGFLFAVLASQMLGPIMLDYRDLGPGPVDPADMPYAGSPSNRAVLLRASGDALAQTSATTTDWQIGVDVPRVCSVDGTNFGLRMERARQQLLSFASNLADASGSGWPNVAGTLTRTANYGTGPHGVATYNTRFQATNCLALQTNGVVGTVAGLAYGDRITYFGWAKGTSGADRYDVELNRSSGGASYNNGPLTALWALIVFKSNYEYVNIGSPTGPTCACVGDGQGGAAPADTQNCFYSAEKGQIAQSPIFCDSIANNVGQEIYQEGDEHFLPDASEVIFGGVLIMELRWRQLAPFDLLGGQGVTETEQVIWAMADTGGGANRCSVDYATRQVTLIVDGTPQTWGTALTVGTANADVQAFVATDVGGVSRFAYRRGGAGAYTDLGAGAAMPALTATGEIWMGCDGPNSQTIGDIAYEQFFRDAEGTPF